MEMGNNRSRMKTIYSSRKVNEICRTFYFKLLFISNSMPISSVGPTIFQQASASLIENPNASMIRTTLVENGCVHAVLLELGIDQCGTTPEVSPEESRE